jgi:hypothetical protein
MPVIGPAIGSAIQTFLAKITVPVLLVGTEHGVIPHGTGTFFEIGDSVFLILARHLLDDVEPANLAVPVGSEGPEVQTLGPFEILRPTDDHLDVTALKLKDPDLVSRFRAGWRFLGLSHVTMPSKDGAFILAGYPASATLKRGDILGGRLLSFYTERLERPPALASFLDQPHDPQVDLFFKYSATGMLMSTGEDKETPALPGASGASVWEWREPEGNGLWTPEAVLKVVAVQSSWSNQSKKWFRATGWQVVFNTLRQAGISVT